MDSIAVLAGCALAVLVAGAVIGWLVRGRSAAWCNACGRPVGHLCVGCWRSRPELRMPASIGTSADWR